MPQEDPATFGDNLKKCRTDAGLTVSQAAAAAGISASLWNECESGDKNPAIGVTYKMQRALGIAVKGLL